MSLPDIAAIIGAVVAVLGFAVQIWAARRRDLRELELHKQVMDGFDDE